MTGIGFAGLGLTLTVRLAGVVAAGVTFTVAGGAGFLEKSAFTEKDGFFAMGTGFAAGMAFFTLTATGFAGALVTWCADGDGFLALAATGFTTGAGLDFGLAPKEEAGTNPSSIT